MRNKILLSILFFVAPLITVAAPSMWVTVENNSSHVLSQPTFISQDGTVSVQQVLSNTYLLTADNSDAASITGDLQFVDQAQQVVSLQIVNPAGFRPTTPHYAIDSNMVTGNVHVVRASSITPRALLDHSVVFALQNR